MDLHSETSQPVPKLSFYGGIAGALLPFLVFLSGVITIALSGAPDERGFWPVLILALTLGLTLARDKKAFSETVIKGMSEPIVMIMITAWILASTVGVLMTAAGLVEALSWIASRFQLGGPGMVVATFLICCIVSLSTGSSFATILICGPILYPAGGLMGAHLPTLAGAIIGGATFGDFFAPISDTTIASALSQKAEIGPTVRSRLKYILPAAILALAAFGFSAWRFSLHAPAPTQELTGNPAGLPMILVPALIIFLFLRGQHLLQGLLTGLAFGIVLGLLTGLLQWEQVLSFDLENFTTRSLIIDGINRAVGISFFTILLMGMVATLKAAGLVDRLVGFAAGRSRTPLQAESWITGTVATAVLLTTHSVVAILMVAEFANKTGARMGITPTRRANLLSLVVCVFPFLLPYFIPVILIANTTQSGRDFGIAPVAPLEAGLYNFLAWALLLVALSTLVTGWGRKRDAAPQTSTMQKENPQ